jgi:hypothetical protein
VETRALVRQTPLYEAAAIELGAVAGTLSAERDARRLLVEARSESARSRIEVDLLNPTRYVQRTEAIDPCSEPSSGGRPRRATRAERITPDDGAYVHLPAGAKEIFAAGRYYLRPWFDRGALAGRYLVQLTDDGTGITVYRRGLTQYAWPDVGDR